MSQSQSLQDQKRRELDQFTEFARVCRCVPPGIPSQPSPPEPDIVLPGPLGFIGIELTDITLGERGQRAYEGEQKLRMDTAKELYHARERQPISAGFAWVEGGRLWGGDRARDAATICELIASNPPTGNVLRTIGDGMSLIRPDLPLTMITVFEASSWDAADWQDGSFHKVEPCEALAIQAHIDRKNPKVADYQVPYASRWLMLVLEAEGPSTWGVVLDEVRKNRFDSQFDRVFLFEQGHRRWHELNTQ